MAAGLLAVSAFVWVPNVKAAFDWRKSSAGTLYATIASSGIDAAVKQYHDLKKRIARDTVSPKEKGTEKKVH